MNKKTISSILLLLCISVTSFSQTKPRLGILPFTGGIGGDGETIATLFSFERNILEAFTVVPRTGAVNAIVAEQNFQMSGYTDSDTIAGLGRMLNADFVVSGHIRRLGDRNLIITTIINVETFEQLAGDFHEYRNIEEVRDILPEISRKIIIASRRDTSHLPKLAVMPFNIANVGIDVQTAEVLTQILAVEITNTGKFSILPRTSTMQAALEELDFQMQGHTLEDEAKALGKAINAEYVLAAEVRSLGSLNLFTAQILHVADGSLLAGDSRDYRTISDGITLMTELALLLTDKTGAQARISAIDRERNRTAVFGNPAKFWSIGIFAGTSFIDPWLIGTIRGTIALIPNSFIEIGIDAGFISSQNWESYYSLQPFIHYDFFLPYNESIGWYIGAGGSFLLDEYRIDDLKISGRHLAADFTTGINLWNMLDISYTLRTNFTSVSNKISLGYTYRFR